MILKNLCLAVACLAPAQDPTTLLEQYVNKRGEMPLKLTLLGDLEFLKLTPKNRFSRSVLEICILDQVTDVQRAWMRFEKVSLKSVRISDRSTGVGALSIKYRNVKDSRYLLAAVKIKLDGAYADSEGLIFTKLILNVEKPNVVASARIISAIRILRKRSVPEFDEDILDYLRKLPASKLRDSLVSAWS
jgi:hypothetical protein